MIVLSCKIALIQLFSSVERSFDILAVKYLQAVLFLDVPQHSLQLDHGIDDHFVPVSSAEIEQIVNINAVLKEVEQRCSELAAEDIVVFATALHIEVDHAILLTSSAENNFFHKLHLSAHIVLAIVLLSVIIIHRINGIIKEKVAQKPVFWGYLFFDFPRLDFRGESRFCDHYTSRR